MPVSCFVGPKYRDEGRQSSEQKAEWKQRELTNSPKSSLFKTNWGLRKKEYCGKKQLKNYTLCSLYTMWNFTSLILF